MNAFSVQEPELRCGGPGSGLDGIQEMHVQALWLRQALDTEALCTWEGARVKVDFPGFWNGGAGPDFLDARLRLDGAQRRGAVEVHFHERDWKAHRHDRDAAYRNVVLHVLLYPPRGREVAARTVDGSRIPRLVLLPYLREPLESLLEGAVTCGWPMRPGNLDETGFLFLNREERLERLRSAALRRFREKVRYAYRRLDACGWQETCHQMTLEALGFRRNRAPMGAVALRYPLGTDWQKLDMRQVFQREQSRWRLGATRPANHPRRRLEAYRALAVKNPEWPGALHDWLMGCPRMPFDPLETTAAFRRAVDWSARADFLHRSVLQNQFGRARVHTLLADVFFPLAEAALGNGHTSLWFHQEAGDFPARIAKWLRLCLDQPRCNGLVQGALGLLSSS